MRRSQKNVLLVLAVFGSSGISQAQTTEPLFQNGFEPRCYGTANDRPGCLVLPFNGAPLTGTTRIAFSAKPLYDIYTLVDRSGSTLAETANLKNDLEGIASALSCSTSPALNTCVDAWWGVGEINYVGISGTPGYRNVTDLAPPSSTLTDGIIPTEPGGCCNEASFVALSATITGLGADELSCSILGDFALRATCAGSPAATNGFTGIGWPCFRANAYPIVLFNGDENPSAGFNCPVKPTVSAAFNARSARIIGLFNGTLPSSNATDMAELATSTGAVDANNGNAPLVFSADGINASVGLQNAVNVLANQPFSYSAVVVDDPSDAIDVSNLIAYVEVINDGSDNCPLNAAVSDTDADLHPDRFNAIAPAQKLCFRLVGSQNTTVPALSQPQLYRGYLRSSFGSLAQSEFFVVIPATAP